MEAEIEGLVDRIEVRRAEVEAVGAGIGGLGARVRVLVSEVLVLVVRVGSLIAGIGGLVAQVRGLVSRNSIRPAQDGVAAVSVQSSVAAIGGLGDWAEG